MKRFFGPGGLLQQKLEHFEYRALQQEMAEAVARAMANAGHLLVEAGTGTGKTWAYLIPAIVSGRRVLISTGTKTLQDQILDHDVPILRDLLFPQLKVVCLKGRRNYLCLRRFAEFSFQPSLWKPDELRYLARLQHWANQTQTGDRADIDWLPDDFHTWNELTASGSQCPGPQCDRFSSCFLTRIRRQAAEADLVVVNHHLFFADLALRNSGIVELLPEYEAVVFDEAHQLEDTIALYYGVQFASFAVRELAQDLLRTAAVSIKDPNLLRPLQSTLDHLQQLLKQLHASLREARPKGAKRTPLDALAAGAGFFPTANQMAEALKHLSATLTPYGDRAPELETGKRRAQELGQNLALISSQQEPDTIYWYELFNRGSDFLLNATPIEIASIFRQELLDKIGSVILTSATLSTPQQSRLTFSFIKDRLGFPQSTEAHRLPSPFDFQHQTLLYVPASFPEPHLPNFCARMTESASEIIRRSQGRALFLFTSYRNMGEAAAGLQDQLPYPVLVQGQKPKRVLLAEFKNQIESVLLATYSFWEGVDVPGESLSCVLIDKLPFEVPTDPIVKARLDHLARSGKNPFYHYQIPRAAIHLQQGVGRLIRSQADRGVVVIFDVRLCSKSYGKMFLNALPDMPLTRKIEELERFFRNPAADFSRAHP